MSKSTTSKRAEASAPPPAALAAKAGDSGSPSSKAVPAGKTESVLRVVVADDDLTCRELMRISLETEPNIEVVGTAVTGPAVLEAVAKLKPDFIMLDIEMPELDGFGVLERIGQPDAPLVVIVTSHERFALKAFDFQVVDYLVKPWSLNRFRLALARVREEMRRVQAVESAKLSETASVEDSGKSRFPERFAVKSDGRIRFVRVLDIDWIEAADNYVVLHVGAESHFLRETMSGCETRLSPAHFQRISRSTIVNLERIKELQPLFHGDYSVVLRNGTRLQLSRRYRHKLPQLG